MLRSSKILENRLARSSDGRTVYSTFCSCVVTANYVDDPGGDEEERAYNPFNDDGYLFFAAYGRNDKWTGISDTFRTEAEAVAQAERTILDGIKWDE
jgi:hypothetical protein